MKIKPLGNRILVLPVKKENYITESKIELVDNSLSTSQVIEFSESLGIYKNGDGPTLMIRTDTDGLPIIEQIRKATSKVCDVHVMILEPEKYAEAFKKAGADVYTVHIEACPHLHRNLQQAKQLGMKAGVALNPHTPIQSLVDVIQDIDVVCLMSVNPGFGGQQFIPQTLSRIAELKALIIQKNASTLIQIDGGVTLQNAPEILAAGADVLVAGNTVFKSENPTQTIAALKAL